MDRSYLTHPRIVVCAWEGVLLYPVLWVLSDDGALDEDRVDPAYLSVVTRVPVETVSAGVDALRGSGVLSDQFILSRCFSSRTYASVPSRVPDAQALACPGEAPEGGVNAPAHSPPPVRTREGFDAYLVEQWGDLVTRGKPLAEWVDAQVDAHPALDLLAEAKKARAWEVNQKKPKKAIRRFLGNWLNRAEGFKEETKIRAEGGVAHWSGMSKRDRERSIQEGRTEFSVLVSGVSLTRDLRDDMFVLSGQDLTSDSLPYRELLSSIIRDSLNGNGDPYDPEPFKASLTKSEARAESDRALTWAVDQIVTDVRYELGLLPV